MFPSHGSFDGPIVSVGLVDSTLYPGTKRRAHRVCYPFDGQVDDFEDEELRPLLVVTDLPERAEIIKAINPAFDYLESRILGTCEA